MTNLSDVKILFSARPTFFVQNNYFTYYGKNVATYPDEHVKHPEGFLSIKYSNGSVYRG